MHILTHSYILVILFIDITAMPYLKDQDYDFLILDVSNQTIVADAIAPFARAIRDESFPMTTRIIRPDKVLLDPGHDDPRLLRIHLLERLLSPALKLYLIWNHSKSSSFIMSSKDIASDFLRCAAIES